MEAGEALIRYLSQQRAIILSASTPVGMLKAKQPDNASKTFVSPEDSARLLKQKTKFVTTDGNDATTEYVLEARMLVVETVLMHAYLLHSPSLCGPLIRVSKCLQIDESERLLMQHGRTDLLIDFYFAYGLHQRATDWIRGHQTELMVPYLQSMQACDMNLITKCCHDLTPE